MPIKFGYNTPSLLTEEELLELQKAQDKLEGRIHDYKLAINQQVQSESEDVIVGPYPMLNDTQKQLDVVNESIENYEKQKRDLEWEAIVGLSNEAGYDKEEEITNQIAELDKLVSARNEDGVRNINDMSFDSDSLAIKRKELEQELRNIDPSVKNKSRIDFVKEKYGAPEDENKLDEWQSQLTLSYHNEKKDTRYKNNNAGMEHEKSRREGFLERKSKERPLVAKYKNGEFISKQDIVDEGRRKHGGVFKNKSDSQVYETMIAYNPEYETNNPTGWEQTKASVGDFINEAIIDGPAFISKSLQKITNLDYVTVKDKQSGGITRIVTRNHKRTWDDVSKWDELTRTPGGLNAILGTGDPVKLKTQWDDNLDEDEFVNLMKKKYGDRYSITPDIYNKQSMTKLEMEEIDYLMNLNPDLTLGEALFGLRESEEAWSQRPSDLDKKIAEQTEEAKTKTAECISYESIYLRE